MSDKKSSKELARDGYFQNLPEKLQTELLNAHKMIVDKVTCLLKDPKYQMIKESNVAMSNIDDFIMGPAPTSDTGMVRAYCKGKDEYSCMIQLTGHFRNFQNDSIEELLHEFIDDVYTSLKPVFKKEFKFDLDSEGADGNSFEGFDVYPDKEVAKCVWELFEDYKTKTVIECSQDLLDYYEFYTNMTYDQFFYEKSHGTLKYDFRKAYDWNTGHGLKIVYSLDNININNIGVGYIGGNSPKEVRKQTADNIQKNITLKGNSDHQSSGQKVMAIVDRVTGENLKSVETIGPFAPAVPASQLSIFDIDELHNYYNSKGKEFIDMYVNKITVGDIDNSPTFKATHWFKKSEDMKELNNGVKIKSDNTITRGNAAEALKYGRGAKMNDIDPKGTMVVGNKPVYIHPSKKDIRDNPSVYKKESSDNTPEYNVDMTESNAKKALRVVSNGIINDMAKSKGKQVTQYTLNIYANVITKNLLPKWTKGYRSIKITLDTSNAGKAFEFIPPTMSQDFVSRFVAGRESLNGFLHKTSEIRMRISPNTFKTMKDPDDAFNFFKSAIQYYDSKVEKYGNKLMSEVMKLGYNMKHLIGNSKLSGLVTYPLSLLFTFDNVNMSSKDTFAIKDDDIQTINKFVRNIASRYAAPEKEKRQIVDDVKKMVTTLKESCEFTDNIRNLLGFPESLEQLYFNGFEDVIMESSRMFIESNIDHEWMRNCNDPKLKLIQEQYHVKKLKKIPADIVAYVSIEAESIKDANDKMMIASYCLGKLEIVEWYIELLEVGSNRYVVPHTKAYLQGVRTQLLACFKRIMDTPLPKADRPLIDIQYPKGYEG